MSSPKAASRSQSRKYLRGPIGDPAFERPLLARRLAPRTKMPAVAPHFLKESRRLQNLGCLFAGPARVWCLAHAELGLTPGRRRHPHDIPKAPAEGVDRRIAHR